MSARSFSSSTTAGAWAFGDVALGGLIERLHASVEQGGLAARVLHKRAAHEALSSLSRWRAAPARRVFARAARSPEWLCPSELERLQRRYPYQPFEADPSTSEAMARRRARELLQTVPGDRRTHFLDLGCGNGRVACNLQRSGSQVSAIDLRRGIFAAEVERSAVRFLEMDAADLAFDDDSFDVVYSYDAFEHFADPEAVLRQVIRVLRPGGYFFASFGPLYRSPWGAHQWHCIDVPYCHLLFRADDLNEFAARHAQPYIGFRNLNRWTVGQFRELWRRHQTRLERLRYSEKLHVGYLDVIRTYPSCFRSKTDCFDDLVVRSVEVLCRKRE